MYEINKNDKKVDLLYSTPEQKSSSAETALSKIENQEESVKKFLTDMTIGYTIEKKLDKATEKIPLYILGTAGMREIDSQRANSIYEKIYNQAKVLNGFHLKSAKTISGQYEGFYAWIATNYKNGKLGFSTSTSEKPLTYTGEPYGILEIGGASLQITFAANKSDANCISREGFSNIYSKSYLGWGVNSVFKKYGTAETYNFTDPSMDLRDVKTLISPNVIFWGLGRSIRDFFTSDAQSFEDYSNNNKKEDDKPDRHRHMNAEYFKYITNSLGLRLNVTLTNPTKESDWTEGAALDIIINKKEPEVFDYQKRN